MTPGDWAGIIAAVAAVLTALGGGFRFLINRADRKDREEAERQAELRDQERERQDAKHAETYDLLNRAINDLRETVARQAGQLEALSSENRAMAEHIARLETILASYGIEAPMFEPPYNTGHRVGRSNNGSR